MEGKGREGKGRERAEERFGVDEEVECGVAGGAVGWPISWRARAEQLSAGALGSRRVASTKARTRRYAWLLEARSQRESHSMR